MSPRSKFKICAAALQRIAGSHLTEFGDEPDNTAVEAMTIARTVISEMQKGTN